MRKCIFLLPVWPSKMVGSRFLVGSLVGCSLPRAPHIVFSDIPLEISQSSPISFQVKRGKDLIGALVYRFLLLREILQQYAVVLQ